MRSPSIKAVSRWPSLAPTPCISSTTWSPKVSDSSKPLLDVAVERLSECPEINITITGHTDSIGAAEYNNGLSYRRAEATKNYLVGAGVSASRLSAEGVGEAQPVASNDSQNGRAENRRVEIGPSN